MKKTALAALPWTISGSNKQNMGTKRYLRLALFLPSTHYPVMGGAKKIHDSVRTISATFMMPLTQYHHSSPSSGMGPGYGLVN